MKGLRVDEVSGVDAPAHLAQGWMVLKSADGTDPLAGLSDEEIEEAIKALGAVESDDEGEPVQELIDSLTKAMGSMADPAQKAAAATLIAALGGDAGTGAGKGDDPVAKAVADALTKAQTERDEALAKAKTAEDELAKRDTTLKALGGGATETEEEALAKAMATLPEPMRKHLEAQQERLAKAEEAATKAAEDAKVEREARVSAEYLTKARGSDYANLPASPETRATILREVDEKLSKEAGAELHRILKAASHLANGGAGDFREYGGVGADATGRAGAQAQIEKAADDLQAKDPNLDRATALTKAADNNPDLVRVIKEATS